MMEEEASPEMEETQEETETEEDANSSSQRPECQQNRVQLDYYSNYLSGCTRPRDLKT